MASRPNARSMIALLPEGHAEEVAVNPATAPQPRSPAETHVGGASTCPPPAALVEDHDTTPVGRNPSGRRSLQTPLPVHLLCHLRTTMWLQFAQSEFQGRAGGVRACGRSGRRSRPLWGWWTGKPSPYRAMWRVSSSAVSRAVGACRTVTPASPNTRGAVCREGQDPAPAHEAQPYAGRAFDVSEAREQLVELGGLSDARELSCLLKGR
jgi:hypothetical protein